MPEGEFANSLEISSEINLSNSENKSEKDACEEIAELIEEICIDRRQFSELTKDQQREVLGKWENVKNFLENNIIGEELNQALGLFSKLWITLIKANSSARSTGELYKELKSFFPEEIPDFVVKLKDEQEAPAIQWTFFFENDELYAKLRLKEIILAKPNSLNLKECDINQDDLPLFLHGFSDQNLENVLSNGLFSDRKLREILGKEEKYQMQETAFPMYVSFCRPRKYEGPWASYSKNEADEAGGAYRQSSIWGNYGPSDRVPRQIAAIIDFDFIMPKSFKADHVEWFFMETHRDEYESTIDHIPPDKIIGLICAPEIKDEMTNFMEKSTRKDVKLYDIYGNLFWPNEKSKEEVATDFKRNVLDKIRLSK